MIQIAICDDDKKFRDFLAIVISEYLWKRHFGFKISFFKSKDAFLNLGVDMAQYEIVFLNIDMKGMDGLAAAYYMRKICIDSYFVLVSASTKYSLEGYKLDAIRYILKDSTDLKCALIEALEAICKKMDVHNMYIREFSFKTGKKKVILDNIMYIESQLHELFFYLLENEKQNYQMNKTLNQIENELNNKNFLRIHQSFLANMNFIKSIKQREAILLDGTKLPISKSRYSYAKKKFEIFKEEQNK